MRFSRPHALSAFDPLIKQIVIYTTNLGLPYTIKSMFDVKNNQSNPKVTTAYKNDALNECMVSSMDVTPGTDGSYVFEVWPPPMFTTWDFLSHG